MNPQLLIGLSIFLLSVMTANFKAQEERELDTVELKEQALENYKKADAELNVAYKQLMTTTDASDKPLLIQAQRDWIKYRDSHCAFEVKMNDGGSLQALFYHNCLTETTKQRTAVMKESYGYRNN